MNDGDAGSADLPTKFGDAFLSYVLAVSHGNRANVGPSIGSRNGDAGSRSMHW